MVCLTFTEPFIEVLPASSDLRYFISLFNHLFSRSEPGSIISNPYEFEFSTFGWNRTGNLRIAVVFLRAAL